MNELILLCAGAAGDPPPDDAGLVPPPSRALRRLLARGRVRHDLRLAGDPQAELPEDAWLRSAFAVPAGACIEAFTGVQHALGAPWWSLTPCHLHLGLDHAMLVDPAQLALTPADADALARAAAPCFEALGLALRWPHPERWFVLGEAWRLQTWPWTLASGRNIIAWQPTGEDGRAWRRLLTEVQMAWHEHPVNQARAERGQRAVNALWLNGFVPALPPRQADRRPGTVITGRPALAGLAASAGWTVLEGDWPASLRTPLPETTEGGPLLIDAGGWRTARRLGDREAWLGAWADADAWLGQAALAAALARAGGRLRVVLSAERRLVELETPGIPAWRFWQRFDSMAAIGARS